MFARAVMLGMVGSTPYGLGGNPILRCLVSPCAKPSVTSDANRVFFGDIGFGYQVGGQFFWMLYGAILAPVVLIELAHAMSYLV